MYCKCYSKLAERRVCMYCRCYSHRWTRLLKQQTSIKVYLLPTKKNKLPFSVSVGSEQTEVGCFCCLFAANKRKLLFYISSIFRIYIYIYIETAAYIYKRKSATSICLLQTDNGNGKLLHMYIYFCIYIREKTIYNSICIYIYICCSFKWKTETQVIFLNPFTICTSLQTEVCTVDTTASQLNAEYVL